jgi:hypothetical protein
MTARIRAATEADAEPCGRIIFEAFKGIAEQHAFPLDFPSPEIATQLAKSFIADPWIFGVVAEKDGRVVGSNFLAEADPIVGLGRSPSILPSKAAALDGNSWKSSSTGGRMLLASSWSQMRSTRVRWHSMPHSGSM